MGPRQQGDIGELSAMSWLAEQGSSIYLPVGHSPDVSNGRLIKVQVKTTRFSRNGRWNALLATRGGNQSWTGVVKRFDPSRYYD